MNDKERQATDQATDTEEARRRAPYSSPQLRVYGTVTGLTKAGGTLGAEGNSGKGSFSGSDRAIKDNIVRVGTHRRGFGLYLFDFKPEYRETWGHERQFGVMADEVECVVPQAVACHPEGYRLVDYARLGIQRGPRH